MEKTNYCFEFVNDDDDYCTRKTILNDAMRMYHVV